MKVEGVKLINEGRERTSINQVINYRIDAFIITFITKFILMDFRANWLVEGINAEVSAKKAKNITRRLCLNIFVQVSKFSKGG